MPQVSPLAESANGAGPAVKTDDLVSRPERADVVGWHPEDGGCLGRCLVIARPENLDRAAAGDDRWPVARAGGA